MSCVCLLTWKGKALPLWSSVLSRFNPSDLQKIIQERLAILHVVRLFGRWSVVVVVSLVDLGCLVDFCCQKHNVRIVCLLSAQTQIVIFLFWQFAFKRFWFLSCILCNGLITLSLIMYVCEYWVYFYGIFFVFPVL